MLAKALTEWDLKIWVYRVFYRQFPAGFRVVPSPRTTATSGPRRYDETQDMVRVSWFLVQVPGSTFWFLVRQRQNSRPLTTTRTSPEPEPGTRSSETSTRTQNPEDAILQKGPACTAV